MQKNSTYFKIEQFCTFWGLKAKCSNSPIISLQLHQVCFLHDIYIVHDKKRNNYFSVKPVLYEDCDLSNNLSLQGHYTDRYINTLL